jgi:hypothetical protein
MNIKKILLTLVTLVSVIWQLPAQTIDAANSFQMLSRPDGSTKRFGVNTPTSTSKEVRAFHTYGRPEKLTIRFLGDWLDITDEVPNPGSGITVDAIVSKGKTRISNRDVPYCEVRFNIAAKATDGNRTVRLRRPAPFGKDETVYTINLQKNIRISSPSPVHTSNHFGNNQSFSITAEGMNKWVRTDQPTIPSGSIVSALSLFTTNDANRYDFRAVFRAAGNMTYNELFNNHLIMTTGTVAVHMGAGLSMSSIALVSNQPPPPPLPLSPNPSSISFGSVCVGENITRSVTITNTTSNPITIGNISFFGNGFASASALAGTVIAAGASSNFTIRFQPTAVGSSSGRAEISHSAGSAVIIQLSGSGTNPLSISSSSVSFGNNAINITTNRTVTITNVCPTPVTINTIAFTNAGGPFTLAGINNGAVVPANGSLNLTVNFRPVASGNFSNTIRITPASGNVMNINVSGSGTAPELSLSLLNTFYSDATLTNADRDNYNLCPIQTRDGIPINTEIPRIRIRVSNFGLAASPATTMVFTRETNTNYSSSNSRITINVPIIQPGAEVILDAPLRLNSLVCTVKTSGICGRCNAAINPHWNDRGICVTLTPVPGDTNTFDDRVCIQ